MEETTSYRQNSTDGSLNNEILTKGHTNDSKNNENGKSNIESFSHMKLIDTIDDLNNQNAIEILRNGNASCEECANFLILKAQKSEQQACELLAHLKCPFESYDDAFKIVHSLTNIQLFREIDKWYENNLDMEKEITRLKEQVGDLQKQLSNIRIMNQGSKTMKQNIKLTDEKNEDFNRLDQLTNSKDHKDVVENLILSSFDKVNPEQMSILLKKLGSVSPGSAYQFLEKASEYSKAYALQLLEVLDVEESEEHSAKVALEGINYSPIIQKLITKYKELELKAKDNNQKEKIEELGYKVNALEQTNKVLRESLDEQTQRVKNFCDEYQIAIENESDAKQLEIKALQKNTDDLIKKSKEKNSDQKVTDKNREDAEKQILIEVKQAKLKRIRDILRNYGKISYQAGVEILKTVIERFPENGILILKELDIEIVDEGDEFEVLQEISYCPVIQSAIQEYRDSCDPYGIDISVNGTIEEQTRTIEKLERKIEKSKLGQFTKENVENVFNAIINPDVEKLQELFKDNPFSVLASRNEKYTPLTYAAKNNYNEIILQLCEWGHDIPGYLDTFDNQRMNAFMYFCLNERKDMVKRFIEMNADVAAKGFGGKNGLMIAAAKGYIDIIREIIDVKGFKEKHINDIDDDGMTALMYASQNGRIAVSTYLIKNNADGTIKDKNGWNALMIACAKGYYEIAVLLIRKAHVDVEEQDINGLTALMFACSNGNSDLVKFLLSAKGRAHPDRIDRFGNTAIIYAAQKGNEKVMKTLRDNKASEEPNVFGQTPESVLENFKSKLLSTPVKDESSEKKPIAVEKPKSEEEKSNSEKEVSISKSQSSGNDTDSKATTMATVT